MTLELITEDFIGAKYEFPLECPLAKALKRNGCKAVSVGGTGLWINDINNRYSIPENWEVRLVNRMINDANNGLDVNYTLTLTPIDNA